MDMLNSPFKQVDEFELFKRSLNTLHSRDPPYMNNVISQLSEQDRKHL